MPKQIPTLANVRQRALLVLIVLGYVALYQFTYVRWLSPWYSYLGFAYAEPPPAHWLIGWAIALLPALWMPIGLRRPSQVIYWALYLAVYVPSILAPMYMGLRPWSDVLSLMLALVAGFAIVGLSYIAPLLPVGLFVLPRRYFLSMFGVTFVGLFTWVIIAFRGRMQIVSFEDVYQLRFAAEEVLAGSNLGYGIGWLGASLNPFLMARGLAFKRSWLFLLGAVGQVTLYSIAGAKVVVLSIILLPALYILMKGGLRRFGIHCAAAVLMLLAANNVFNFTVGDDPTKMGLSSLFMMRTVGMPGSLLGLYQDFFATHSKTFYSHVHGISSLVTYPYENSIGQELGNYYFGNPRLNCNAHLWATDGIAALGIPGVLVVSVFCACVFWLMDTAAKRHDIVFASLVFIYAAEMMANSSLFTSFLTGGIGLSILLLWVAPPQVMGSTRRDKWLRLPLAWLRAPDSAAWARRFEP